MYSEIPDLPSWLFIVCHSILSLAMVISGIRLWKGPTIMDRIVALDLIAALIMGHTVLLVFASSFISYLDVVTAIAVISFLATIAFARYLEKKEVPI